MEWKVVLLAIALLAIGFAEIAIKILVKKDGQFSGTCASQNPLINKDGEEFGRVIGEVDFISESFLKIIKKYI